MSHTPAEKLLAARRMYNRAVVQDHRAWRMRCEAVEMRLRTRELREQRERRG